MARKKASETTESVSATPETAEQKPKRVPRKPKAEESKAEPTATQKPKVGLFGKAKAAPLTPEPEPVAEPAPAPAPVEAKKPTERKPKARPVAEPVEEPSTESAVEMSDVQSPAPGITLRFRPRAEKPSTEKPRAEKAKAEYGVKELTEKPASAPKPETAKPEPAKPSRRKPKDAPTFSVDEEGRFSVLEWREKGERPVVAEPVEAKTAETEEPKAKHDRRKKKKQDSAQPAEKQVEVAVVAIAEPEPAKPEVPQFEPIVVPESAAQVVVSHGQPILVKNKRAIAPLLFSGSAAAPDRKANFLEQAKLAMEHGIHLIGLSVDLVVDLGGVSKAAELVLQTVRDLKAISEEVQVLVRIRFTSPTLWPDLYPNAVFKKLDGTLGDPSFSSDDYWSTAEKCLADFVTALSGSPESTNLLGVHLDREAWHHSDLVGYDTSSASTERFRRWLRQRYRNDIVTLRASWYDGQVQFDTAAIPEYGKTSQTGESFVRMDRKSRRWIDCQLFLSDIIVERLYQLCYTAKKASNGNFLVGTSYGFTFEWSHPASGHLSLGKLLRCPFLDFLSGPPSYRHREPGGTASPGMPVDSVWLNGKLYISEEDFKTPIGNTSESDSHNPVMKTPQALESAHWRGVGAALAHRGGQNWIDQWGNGWLGSRGIWERADQVRKSLIRRLAIPAKDPEVAMFIDERSLALLDDTQAFSVLVQNVQQSLIRSGLNVGFYLLSDLAHRENFPESKLYIFANAWDMRPEVRSAIKNRLQRDNKVLFWLYAAGLFEGGRESLERVREVTGIALRPQPFNSKPGTTLINSRDPLCQPLPADVLKRGGQLEPSYFAIPEDGTVLAEYTQTALASYVVRKFENEDGGWTSVFLGEPVVNPGLVRALGNLAGAHVWCHNDDVVLANGSYVTIHCSGTGPRTLNLPDKWVAYRLDLNEYIPVEKNAYRFSAIDGTTYTFLVGQAAEVETLINGDIDELSKIDLNLVREDATKHWDSDQFDVPIMKLDEWVEETWGDDLESDLLIKPSLIDIDLEEESGDETEAEQPRSRGGRRRRRRKGGRDQDPRGGRDDREKVGEGGFNVLFRKRD